MNTSATSSTSTSTSTSITSSTAHVRMACDAASQRYRLLRWLQECGAIDTIEARTILGIISPASRIFELRARGHTILTIRIGKRRIAQYVLVTPTPPRKRRRKGGAS